MLSCSLHLVLCLRVCAFERFIFFNEVDFVLKLHLAGLRSQVFLSVDQCPQVLLGRLSGLRVLATYIFWLHADALVVGACENLFAVLLVRHTLNAMLGECVRRAAAVLDKHVVMHVTFSFLPCTDLKVFWAQLAKPSLPLHFSYLLAERQTWYLLLHWKGRSGRR